MPCWTINDSSDAHGSARWEITNCTLVETEDQPVQINQSGEGFVVKDITLIDEGEPEA